MSEFNNEFFDAWAPLSERRSGEVPNVSYEHFGNHLRDPVRGWIKATYQNCVKTSNFSMFLALRLHRTVMEVEDPFWDDYGQRDTTLVLDVLDALLCLLAQQHEANIGVKEQPDTESMLTNTLIKVLDIGGSAWRVNKDRDGLEKRIDKAMTESFVQAVSRESHVSSLLEDAWRYAFSKDPNADLAWQNAVGAVEAALQPIVSPKDKSATLGKMKSALRDSPSKWVCALDPADPDNSMKLFMNALSVIRYQPGRHGQDTNRADLNAARMVLIQAVTILNWLNEGCLWREESKQ